MKDSDEVPGGSLLAFIYTASRSSTILQPCGRTTAPDPAPATWLWTPAESSYPEATASHRALQKLLFHGPAQAMHMPGFSDFRESSDLPAHATASGRLVSNSSPTSSPHLDLPFPNSCHNYVRPIPILNSSFPKFHSGSNPN